MSERHFSAVSGLTRSNSKRHDSNVSGGENPNSLQRGSSLQRNKIPSESSSKSYVISTRLSNNESVVMLDATQHQGRNNSASSGDNRNTSMAENVFKVPGEKEAEILKARKISTSSKSGMLVNQIARIPMINGSMNKVSRQQTLPHPITSPITPNHHHKLQRSHSNYHDQLQRSHSNQHQVAMPTSFHQKAPNTLQQFGRQQSFHQRPSLLGNLEGKVFNGNGQLMRGSMTPMTQPTQVVMTSSGKGVTYSLDRRQVKRIPHQNSHQNFQVYNHQNNDNSQRKRYVSESINPQSTLINYPIIEDPYSMRIGSLKNKMSLDLSRASDPVNKFVSKSTPVSTT